MTARCFNISANFAAISPMRPLVDEEKQARLRMAIGNGLRPDVWDLFSNRFAIPRILEFYAATESNFSLYNVEGEPGSIGRIPAFLASPSVAAARRSIDARARRASARRGWILLALRRRRSGRSHRPDFRETEAISKAISTARRRSKKVLRDVFETGDAWMRSGDLMRKDARGFYYFVDRVGDSFRWKGENVATAEVAQALAAFSGVVDVSVYGVEIPGRDGRAGMAALVVNDDFDLDGPSHACRGAAAALCAPAILADRAKACKSQTLSSIRSANLPVQGFDPDAIGEPVYFAAPQSSIYSRMDRALYEKILAGAVSL